MADKYGAPQKVRLELSQDFGIPDGIYALVDEDGRKIGDITLNYLKEDSGRKIVYIGWVKSESPLTPANWREIFQQIATLFPEAREACGRRVSGARVRSGTERKTACFTLRRRASRNGAMTGFDLFDDDFSSTPSAPHAPSVLEAAKRDDVVTVGKTKWLIFRKLDSFTAWAYKHPSKQTKAYTIRATGKASDDVEVYETNGMGELIGAPVATGTLKL